MFKKLFSAVLVFLICCTSSATAFSQTEHSLTKENDLSNDNKEPVIINVTSPSPGVVIKDVEMVIASNCVQTVKADSEYLEWLLGAPEEIISGSTLELLEYFMQSPFMGQQVYSCSSTLKDKDIDFSCHEAFREFISREDCIDALEDYARSILYDSKSGELDKTKFAKLLVQPLVKLLISDLTETAATSYPNLCSIYHP